jgi:DnaK suppressor protein
VATVAKKPTAKPAAAAKKASVKAAPAAKKPVAKAAATVTKKATAKPVAKAAPAKPAAAAKKPVAKAAAPVSKKVAAKPVAKAAPAKPAAAAKTPVAKAAAPASKKVAAKPAAKTPPAKPAAAAKTPAAKISATTVKKPAVNAPAPKAPPAKPVAAAAKPAAKPAKKSATGLLSEAELLKMSDKDYMNEAQLAFFRARLQSMKDEILENARETGEHLKENEVFADPNDRATVEEENMLEQRVRDRERKLLKKIDSALRRLDAGDYGYCLETGEPIGVGRLLARPTAELSIEAQEKHERMEKLFAD